MPKDPVCGMEVSEEKAAAETIHEGKKYYFCAEACREKFEENPEKFL